MVSATTDVTAMISHKMPNHWETNYGHSNNINYLLTESEGKSIRQGRDLRISRKDRSFDVTKLYMIWLFCVALAGPFYY